MPGFDLWLEDETVALRLQRSLPRILKRRENDDRAPAIISPRILSRGTPPSEPSAKLTRPHDWDRHARHPRRCRLELGLTLRLPSRRRRDNASSTHLTIGNRANRRLLRCTYGSVRYSEAGFETPAVVGNLSQSNATTGRVSGHTKSRWLFSLLGGAERRAGIIVLPPRSTFLRAHVQTDNVTQGKTYPVRRPGVYGTRSCLAAARSLCPTFAGRWGTWALWRDQARGTGTATANSPICLTLYATEGSCSSLRTADGERPVQRAKA